MDPNALLLPGILGHGFFVADASGTISLPLAPPNLPALRSLVFYTQTFFLAPQGFAASNLKRFVI